MTFRFIVWVGALGGCAQEYPQHADQARITESIWRSYGGDGVEPPVEWREDRCPSAATDAPSAVVIDGACYAGLYLRDDHILVAWRGSFHSSAFAHELMHAWQWEHGVDDPEHLIAADWTRAQAADATLAADNR